MHGGLCPVSYAPSPAPRARVSRVLLPAASSPCSASCVLRPASCTPCPRARAPCPCPCPRPRFTCSAFRVPRFASRAPRPRLPCSASRTRTRTRTRGPAPRARAPVFCVPQTVARVPRPISPPHTSGRLLPASARCRDEKKIGRVPTGTSRFCMHCSGASYSRLRIISPPW